MKISNLMLAGFLTASLFGCNPKPISESQNDLSQIGKDPIDSTITNSGKENTFAKEAALGNMMEVESSAHMIKHTENPDIQTLATMMVNEHIAANTELKDIAKKQKLYIPQVLPADKLNLLKKLDSLQEEYDRNRVYADLMVTEHKKAVVLFKQAASAETDVTLKAYAAKYLPKLQHHLMQAQSVQKIMHIIQSDKGDKPLKISTDREKQ